MHHVYCSFFSGGWKIDIRSKKMAEYSFLTPFFNFILKMNIGGKSALKPVVSSSEKKKKGR